MNLDLILSWLIYALIGFGVIQLFYFTFFYSRVIFWKDKKTTGENDSLPEVSVVIAARNEAENLKENLPYFLEQDYPAYKVIVVNDASRDNSATVLAQLKEKYSNLYITTIPYDDKFNHGKKTALNLGIKAAETEILLFSDADCKPAGKNWIKTVVNNFNDKTDFVIGFGGYEKKKGLLNRIIRTDTVLIAMQYLSYGLAKIPYMGVGRNMAYRKSMFLKKKGFADQMNLLSGSDDLFINKNATRKNLKVELSPESFTISEPKKTLKEWSRQKTRHLTTGKLYKFKHKFLIGLEVFSRVMFIACAVVLLVFNKNLILVLSILISRYVIYSLILLLVNKKFKQKGLFITELIFDIFQPFINFFYYFSAKKKKELIWK